MKKIRYLFFIISTLGLIAMLAIEDLDYFSEFKYRYLFKIIFVIMFFIGVVLIIPEKSRMY